MAEDNRTSTNEARHAVADLQHGLDSARRLVERTRFLLAGDTPQEGDALGLGPSDDPAASAQAAATSETVQKPSGE